MAEITSAVQHSALTPENIHIPYAGVYADETARLAAQLDASMEGKLYRQLSDNTLWMLVSAANKTWIPLGKATAKYLGDGGDDNKPMTFTWAGQEGQPTWLWGGNDGENMYVYSPSSLTVGKAGTADYAATAGSATTAEKANAVSAVQKAVEIKTGLWGKIQSICAPSGGTWFCVGTYEVQTTVGSGGESYYETSIVYVCQSIAGGGTIASYSNSGTSILVNNVACIRIA